MKYTAYEHEHGYGNDDAADDDGDYDGDSDSDDNDGAMTMVPMAMVMEVNASLCLNTMCDTRLYPTATGRGRLLCSTAWGGAGSGTLPRGRSRLLYITAGEEPAPALYRLGGAGFCTPVLYRWGGAGFCTLPIGRIRLLCFTVWEELVSGTLPLGRSRLLYFTAWGDRLLYFTAWEEPASALY